MSYELCEKLRNLKPYEPITGDYAIRLDANESFLDLPRYTRRNMLARIAAAQVNRYPDPLAAQPCELFATYHGISPSLVTAGNGSDELLSILTSYFLMKGERMTVLSPDFSMYGIYAETAEAVVDVYNKNADDTINVDGLIEHINSNKSRMLIFSNPCNPTGLGIEADEVLRIVRSCPDCLIVADEAYMDFWNNSVIGYVNQFDNLMVLRTCSKAFRMAAIRCGFAVGNEKLTQALRAVKSPYNVSTLTQAAAAAILSRPKELRAAAKRLATSRDRLYGELCKLLDKHPDSFTMNKSVTNFLFLKFPEGKAVALFEGLKKSGIIVRLMGNALRITAGNDRENAELIRQMSKLLK